MNEPTVTDAHRAETRRQNMENDRRVAAMEAECRARKTALAAAAPSTTAIMKASIEGLRTYAERFARTGYPKRAQQLKVYIDEASAQFEVYQRAAVALTGRRPDPLHEVARVAASQLMRAVPAGFTTLEAATAWAIKMLPLPEGRAAADKQANEFSRIARQHGEAAGRVDRAIEAGAVLATEKASNEALAAIRLAGGL